MKKLITICAIVVMLLSATNALANFTVIDGTVTTDSWSQLFRENGVGFFDLVAVKMNSADTFESLTHTGFNVSGWATVYENSLPHPTLATATGPATTDMTWFIKFAGVQMGNPLNFTFVAFNGEALLESVNADWNGTGIGGNQPVGGWTMTIGNWNPSRSDLVIPAPGAILLGSIGVGLVGWLKRRRAL